MSDHSVDANNLVPLIRYTGLQPLDGAGMVPLVWSTKKPTMPGWYWWRPATTDDGCIVQVTRFFKDAHLTVLFVTGYRMPIDKILGEWEGPIPHPGPELTMSAQHFYRVEEVEALHKSLREGLAVMVEDLWQCPPEIYQQWLDAGLDSNFYQWQSQRLLTQLRGGA